MVCLVKLLTSLVTSMGFQLVLKLQKFSAAVFISHVLKLFALLFKFSLLNILRLEWESKILFFSICVWLFIVSLNASLIVFQNGGNETWI